MRMHNHEYQQIVNESNKQTNEWLRPRSHYLRNDGDGTVTFYRSHYIFHNANVNVALTWRERRRDNGCHGDVHSDGSRRYLFGSAQAKKWAMATKGKKPVSEVGFWHWKGANNVWADDDNDDEKKKEAIDDFIISILCYIYYSILYNTILYCWYDQVTTLARNRN